MKNKKLISILLTLTMCAGLFAGCSGSMEETTDDSKTEQQTEDDGTVKVAFIPQLIGIPYFTAMDEGGQRAAADLENCEWMYVGDVTASADLQVTQMDSLIRQGVDAMSLSVLDSSSTNPYIEKAQDEGIVVYTSDSDAVDSTRSFYCAQADDVALGETLMECLAQQIGGEGKVGIVSGTATATNLNAWIDAMTAYAEANYPNIEILDVRYTADGSSEQALTQAQELMTANPDIKGIVAVASTTIPGVAQAVEQEGKAGEVKVIGYGSPATVKEYIKSGVMEQSILWNAEALGYLTCWAGYQAATGAEFEPEFYLEGIDSTVTYDAEKGILLLGDPLIIDKDNVDDYNF